MGKLTHKVAREVFNVTINKTIQHVYEDKEKGFLEILDNAKIFMGDDFSDNLYKEARKLANNPEEKWMKYLNRIIDEIHPNVLKKTALNLGFEASLYGTKTIRQMRKIHKCNIPWLILMDPTSSCNLHCTGCWAAEYGNKLNLSYEDMDHIITQGKKLGVYLYMFTGGEPLVRKDDIIRLCEKHNECQFHAFTNGTLIDEEFCKKNSRCW